MIAQILANVHRDQKKRRQPYPIEDFIPARKRKLRGANVPTQRQTGDPTQGIAFVRALNRFFGGTERKKGGG